MNEVGSGGIGAVSAGISHPLVIVAILLLVVLVAITGWKLVKILWAMLG
jgi:uncharacterized membrane protein YtjA (UPF0391 family)